MSIPDEYLLYLSYLPFAANALVVIAATFVILALQRQVRRLQAYQELSTGETLSDEITAQHRTHMQVSLRIELGLSRLERKLHELQDYGRGGEPQGERHLPIDYAIRMAREGATIDELTRACGLSIGEARLTHRLHGEASTAGRPH